MGLLVGLALALVVTLGVTRNNPFVTASPAPTPETGHAPAQTSKPASPAEAPTYDFYKSLPGSQRPAETLAPQFWLQAGAFQHVEEADNVKAKLALLGVEAAIQAVELATQGTLYRVRIGPMRTQEELEATRKRLSDNAISAEPVKNNQTN